MISFLLLSNDWGFLFYVWGLRLMFFNRLGRRCVPAYGRAGFTLFVWVMPCIGIRAFDIEARVGRKKTT